MIQKLSYGERVVPVDLVSREVIIDREKGDGKWDKHLSSGAGAKVDVRRVLGNNMLQLVCRLRKK